MALRAGRLNKRVTLQTVSNSSVEADAYLALSGSVYVLDNSASAAAAFLSLPSDTYVLDNSSAEADAYLTLSYDGTAYVLDSAGGGGGVTETWADTVTLWAHVEEIAGSERYEANQIASNLTHRVTIRYRTGVNPQQRIKYGTRILKISAPPINPDQRNEMLELMCSEEDI